MQARQQNTIIALVGCKRSVQGCGKENGEERSSYEVEHVEESLYISIRLERFILQNDAINWERKRSQWVLFRPID